MRLRFAGGAETLIALIAGSTPTNVRSVANMPAALLTPRQHYAVIPRCETACCEVRLAPQPCSREAAHRKLTSLRLYVDRRSSQLRSSTILSSSVRRAVCCGASLAILGRISQTRQTVVVSVGVRAVVE